MKKHVLLSFVSLLLGLTFLLVGCGKADEGEKPAGEVTYTREGSQIAFGSYPQSQVTDTTLMERLNTAAGTLPYFGSPQNWTSYGYYLRGGVSDFMWYIDVEDGGERYRGVYFTSYRPYWPEEGGDSSCSYQSENGYYAGVLYWFKYEPIYWTILTEENGNALLLCNMILDSQPFDFDSEGYSNNYAESTIRAWLNETFYETAFTQLQQSLILTTTVDNSSESGGWDGNPHACENTEDKLFLLCYMDVVNTDYGFAESPYVPDTRRQKIATAYAKVQGVNADLFHGGHGYWWLRTPDFDSASSADNIDTSGYASSYDGVGDTANGVAPALWIKL